MLRQFNVTPVLNGFVVSVGCQTLVFASNEALEQAIHDYITAPKKTTERFLRHSMHSDVEISQPGYAPREQMECTTEIPPPITRGN